MNRKNWTWIIVAVLLGAISLYINRDWFRADSIHIFDRSRPLARPGRRPQDTSKTMQLSFGFSEPLKLTSVKVVSLADIATNKYPHALWNLVSDSNSVPVKDFFYGVPIQGMRPYTKGTRAENLEPGQKYRLYVETAEFKGQHDFEPKPAKQ